MVPSLVLFHVWKFSVSILSLFWLCCISLTVLSKWQVIQHHYSLFFYTLLSFYEPLMCFVGFARFKSSFIPFLIGWNLSPLNSCYFLLSTRGLCWHLLVIFSCHFNRGDFRLILVSFVKMAIKCRESFYAMFALRMRKSKSSRIVPWGTEFFFYFTKIRSD